MQSQQVTRGGGAPEGLHPHDSQLRPGVHPPALTVVWAGQALNKPTYLQTYTPARTEPLTDNAFRSKFYK